MVTPPSALVIIGSGLAGYTLAREFRKLDEQAPLTIISSDDGSFYSKPMLSNALSKGKEIAQLITSSADEMREKLNATIMSHTSVLAIDTKAHVVSTTHGDIKYQSLLLATGAIPFRPPMTGDAVDEVLSINNLDDYARFRERLEEAQRVAIIGPGLIGCEFANDMLNIGKGVTIIGPDPYPISGLLPTVVGRVLKSALSAQGLALHLGTTATAVDNNGAGYRITLDNGSEITANLVISAVGLRPNIALADAAGIEVNRGIVTDQYLQTSASDVYALGDCAEVNGLNLLFVAPLMAGARALAKTLSGETTAVEYPAMPVVIKTPTCPLVVSPPPRDTEGEWRYEGKAPNITARFSDTSGTLLGFALSGDAVAEKQALTATLPPVLTHLSGKN